MLERGDQVGSQKSLIGRCRPESQCEPWKYQLNKSMVMAETPKRVCRRIGIGKEVPLNRKEIEEDYRHGKTGYGYKRESSNC